MREQGLISVHEFDLYCYLVHRSNRLGWQNPFSQSTEVICAVLRINRNSLLTRREKLHSAGLITYKEGDGIGRPAEYELCPIKRKAAGKPRTKKDEAVKPEKPSVKDIKAFCEKKQCEVDAQAFFDYYEARDWTIGGKPIADWHAVLMKWGSGNRNNNQRKNNFAKYSKSISDVQF